MARLEPATARPMSPEQQAVADRIAAGPRGAVYGPLAIWLHRPALADRAQALGEYCRYGSSLAPALSELAILVTARIWAAEFEWWAHRTHAIKAGLPEAMIEAIRTSQTPEFETDEQRVVYDVARTLNHHRRLPDALYDHALSVLGETRLVDLVGVLGYYALISMTINVFEIDRPDGSPPELA